MTRLRVYGGLLCGLWACDAGPISDFPFAPRGDDNGETPSVRADGGVIGPGYVDAAVPIFPPPGGWSPSDAGTPGPAPSDPDLDAAASAEDGGSDAGVDADVDGTVPDPVDCPVTANSDECVGQYCGLQRDELRQASVAGACTDPVALGAVCSGVLPTRVAQCAQTSLSAGDIPSSARIAECLASSNANYGAPACGACFAEEASCALTACGGAFLTGDELLAARCRALLCGPAFSACSGLPSAVP